jgi:cysteine dioxygenase
MVPIAEFARQLRAIPPSGFTLGGIQQFLAATAVEPESLQPYLCWDAQHYTRNLIDRAEHYELLAICWEPGHASSVHNHHEQNCWMAAPIGRLLVQNYRVVFQNDAAGVCHLEPTQLISLAPGQPVCVEPAEPVHKVYNPREFGQRAVSLHVYSHPYDRCLVYSPEQGKYGEIALTYTTVYGRPA